MKEYHFAFSGLPVWVDLSKISMVFDERNNAGTGRTHTVVRVDGTEFELTEPTDHILADIKNVGYGDREAFAKHLWDSTFPLCDRGK